MQLALPKLRSSSGLKAFNSSLESVEYDLMAWRQRANMPPRDTAILDADDSSGWELAEALLRPRQIEVDEETGAVKFVNTNHEAVRLSVSLALTHNFMKQVPDTDLSLQQGPFQCVYTCSNSLHQTMVSPDLGIATCNLLFHASFLVVW